MQSKSSKLNNGQFSTSPAYIEDHEIEDHFSQWTLKYYLQSNGDITLEQISSMDNYH